MHQSRAIRACLLRQSRDCWDSYAALFVFVFLKFFPLSMPTTLLHGYGVARRIEQISGDMLSLNYGTLYPALLKLEQEGFVSSKWGSSENNRRAKYYTLTRAGQKELDAKTREWNQASGILARFLSPDTESL